MSSTQFTYVTGRQRTLTFSGTFRIRGVATWTLGTLWVKFDCSTQTLAGTYKTSHASGSIQITTPLGTITASIAQVGGEGTFTPSGPFPTPPVLQMTLTLKFQPSNPLHTPQTVTATINGPVFDTEATWSISAGVEQVLQGYTPTPSEPLFTAYNQRVRCYERVKQSTSVACSVSWGPLSISKSDTVTNGPIIIQPYTYEVFQKVEARATNAIGEAKTTASVSGGYSYGASHARTVSGTQSAAHCPSTQVGSWSATGNTSTGAYARIEYTDGVWIETSTSGGLPVDRSAFALSRAQLNQQTDRTVQVDGAIYHFDQPRTEPCELRWYPKGSLAGPGANAGVPLAGPVYSSSYLQRAYDAQIMGQQWFVSEISPVVAYLYPPDLAARGDDATDYEVLTPGLSWPAIEIEHEPDVTVFDGSTSSGWSGTDCAISDSGGIVTLAPSAPGAFAEKSLSPEVNAEGYRYLRLYIRSVGADDLPFTLTIGTKSWVRQTGADGIWSVVDIDMCDPENYSAEAVDDQDSRWPLDLSGVPIDEGELWGINRIPSVEFDGLSDAGAYEIQDLRMIRLGYVKADFLPAHGSFVSYESPGITTAARGVLIDVDGRQAIEQAYRYSSGTAFGQEFEDYLNDTPGFSGSLQPATMFGFASVDPATEPVEYFGGGGFVYDGSWSGYIGREFLGSETVLGQAGHHWIDYHNACGDPFTGAGYGTDSPMVFRFRKILRGRAHGLVVKTTHGPYVSAIVEMRNGGSPAGQGAAGSNGFYETGQPFGSGQVYHDLELMSGAGAHLTDIALTHNRKRVRASFRKESLEGASDPWLLPAPWGHLHRTRTKEGNVLHARADKGIPPWDFEATVTELGIDSHARTAFDRNGAIALFFFRDDDDDPGVYWCRSFDEGRTFSTPELFMPDRRFPLPVHAADGGVLFFAFGYISGTSGPGYIYVRYQGPAEASPDAERPIEDDSGPIEFEAQSFGITPVPSQPDRWVLSAVKSGETEPAEFENYDSVGFKWREL